jgi:hypothetical protein
MENIPAELFDLLEIHSFDELSEKQRSFVLKWMTEEEYRMHQMITEESESLDYSIPQAAPLVIPAPTVPVWKKPIPIWQALSGIAAALLIFFFLPRKTEYVAEPTQIVKVIHDTIVKQLPPDTVFTVSTKFIIDTIFIGSTLTQVLPQRMLEGQNNIYIPWKDAISDISSVSLKDEKVKITLPEVIRVGF